jgi:hypothetical protein
VVDDRFLSRIEHGMVLVQLNSLIMRQNFSQLPATEPPLARLVQPPDIMGCYTPRSSLVHVPDGMSDPTATLYD